MYECVLLPLDYTGSIPNELLTVKIKAYSNRWITEREDIPVDVWELDIVITNPSGDVLYSIKKNVYGIHGDPLYTSSSIYQCISNLFNNFNDWESIVPNMGKRYVEIVKTEYRCDLLFIGKYRMKIDLDTTRE